MKVFVSFGYNERDRWVNDLVIPIVRAFGHETLTGEDLAGQPIEAGVAARIDQSHALIAFVTRRGDPANGIWPTHRWVTDELAYALGRDILILEVREVGVDPQGGLPGHRQHLNYDETKRDVFLKDLAAALGNWPGGQVRLQLVGDALDQIVPLLRRPEFRSVYRFHIRGEESSPSPARILPIKGGLFIDVQHVPPEALIQVEITYQNRTWSSQYESLDSHNIRLIQG